eukprot:4785399-Prymnesium_polylepis.1
MHDAAPATVSRYRVWRRVLRVPCRCAPRAEEAKIFAGPHVRAARLYVCVCYGSTVCVCVTGRRDEARGRGTRRVPL